MAPKLDGSGRLQTLSVFVGNKLPWPGTSLSPLTGLGTDAQLESPIALAIDQSGNLWATNSNGANTVTALSASLLL